MPRHNLTNSLRILFSSRTEDDNDLKKMKDRKYLYIKKLKKYNKEK